MIRITEVKLPLDHDETDLKHILQNRLQQAPIEYHIVRRGYDARRRGYIQFVYTIDCVVKDETVF